MAARGPWRLAVAAFGLFFVLAVFLIVVWQEKAKSPLLSGSGAKGTIRIGYAVEAPYAFVNERGEVTGESPEVAKRIVARLGMNRIEWVQVEFAELISGLENNRFDVIAAGMFITPQRSERVNFSRPSFHVRQGLLVLRGNPHALNAYEGFLKDPNLRCAVVAGSVEERLLREIGVPSRQLLVVPDPRTGRNAIVTRQADGLALSAPTVRWLTENAPTGATEAASPFNQPVTTSVKKLGYGGFAFRKDDLRLLATWNATLDQFVGTREHLRLIEPFGFDSQDLPGATTIEDIVRTP